MDYKCEICKDETLETYLTEQLLCKKCKSIYSERYFIEETENFFDNNVNLSNLLKLIESDMIHYKTKVVPLVKNIFNESKTIFIDLGGGFPKLPLFLSNSIQSLDKFFKVYAKEFNKIKDKKILSFVQGADNKKITFDYVNLLSARSISTKISSILKEYQENYTIVFSFIHVLEHFKYNDIIKIFETISKVINKNKKFHYKLLVYMPNIEKFKKSNQIHAIKNHVFFMPPEVFKNFIESKFSQKEIILKRIDEDFIFICEYEL